MNEFDGMTVIAFFDISLNNVDVRSGQQHPHQLFVTYRVTTPAANMHVEYDVRLDPNEQISVDLAPIVHKLEPQADNRYVHKFNDKK